MPLKRWSPGKQVVVRGMWNGKILTAWAMTVIQDSEDVLALYMPIGTPSKLPHNYPAVRLPVGDWQLRDASWSMSMVRIMYPGDQHSYAWFGKEDGSSLWYVNLESYRRTPTGIDFEDHMLDIVIEPDLTSWRWKDEDELAEAVSLGLISQAQADEIRAEGHRALARLEARSAPFGDGWERWTPDPTWPVPQLPANWHVMA